MLLLQALRNIVILTVFCKIPCVKSSELNASEIVLFLNNFLEYYEHPNKVITYTCLSKGNQKQFQKALQKYNLQASLIDNNLMQNIASQNNEFIFLDLNCPESYNILKQAELLQLFKPSYHWLLFINTTDYLKFLSNHNFPINSNVYVGLKNLYGYLIKDVYKPTKNFTKLVDSFIGYWTTSDGYIEVNSALEIKNRRHLIGEEIGISYVVEDWNTVLHLKDYQYDILIDPMAKFNYALLQHLMSLVNASAKEVFRRSLDTKKIANDNLTDGMIEDIKYGDFVIGGIPIQFLNHKVEEFDFLAKTAKTEKKFIFRATPHSYISNVFTLPFDSYVWYSCFGLMATIFFVAYLVVYWEWKDPIFRNYLSPRLCLRPHPVDIFLMEVGSAAQQGFESEPRSNSGRIVFIFTLISLMFLYTSFSASIVALLQSTAESLNTLESLFDSRIPVGFEENISMRYFEDLNYERKSREFYNKIQKPTFLSIEDGVKKVQEEFFAFYADTAKAYKYIRDWFQESEKCGLREIPFKNTYVDNWLVIKKNSSYKDILRTGMQKIHETGIRDREHRRIFTTKPDCDSAGGNFESVGLADSYGAFLVMVAGIVLSFLLFLMENLWRKYAMSSSLVGNFNEFGDEMEFLGNAEGKYEIEEDGTGIDGDSDRLQLKEYTFLD